MKQTKITKAFVSRFSSLSLELMRQSHLENADPVAAAPPMGRLQAVVAFHSALGEVELPNISKHDCGLLLHDKEGGKH